MELSFTIDSKDVVNSNKFYAKKQKPDNYIIICDSLALIAFFMAPFLLNIPLENWYIYLLFFLLGPLSIFLLNKLEPYILSYRTKLVIKKNPLFLGVRYLAINDNGLYFKSENTEYKSTWDSLRKVYINEKFILLDITNFIIVIPLNKVDIHKTEIIKEIKKHKPNVPIL